MDEAEQSLHEDRRQVEHIVPAAFIPLLAFLPQAALIALAVVALLYAVFGRDLLVRGTHRPDELRRGFSTGKIAYASSVLVLLLVLPHHRFIIAGAWAVMAFGDCASNLVGRRFGRTPLWWRPRLSWQGSAAFVAVSLPLAWGLMLFVARGTGSPTPTATDALILASVASLGGALIETVSFGIDDNLSVPLGAAALLWLISRVLEIV